MQQDWQGATLAQDATAELLRDRDQVEAGASAEGAPSAADARGTGAPVGTVAARRSVCDLTPQELGARGELMAARHLEEKGWEILERNWRCPHGEVDIIARQEGCEKTAVLVEVKTRLCIGRSDEPVPELAVDAEKQERYRRCALWFLGGHPEFTTIRFDVMAINVVEEDGARLRHLFGAYSVDS